jgi:hypothetical protein
MPVSTFIDIIQCWPTTEDLAADIGAPLYAVCKWRQRDFIHPRWWIAIVNSSIAKHHGITLQNLAEAAAQHNNFGGRKRRRRR